VLESLRKEFEPKTWTAFWMTIVEGGTTADAAEATGLSAASVYQAKCRILRKLRARLAGLPRSNRPVSRHVLTSGYCARIADS
jgi:RNA polymerase sigma-70 factor, ECF subfamily